MTTTNTTAKPVCYKCWGTGFVPGCDHVASGICFACEGTGKQRVSTGSREGIGNVAKIWKLANCIVTEMTGRYEVASNATGAVVYVWADGYAVATDGVKSNKKQAEAWASKLVLGLLAA